MRSEIKKYVLEESDVPFTEEELKDLDEEFQKFLKWAEEIDKEEDKLERADK